MQRNRKNKNKKENQKQPFIQGHTASQYNEIIILFVFFPLEYNRYSFSFKKKCEQYVTNMYVYTFFLGQEYTR